ncbi:hypothetical protein PSC71_08065 [Devosia sp. J2-20]|jgi:hypothetical protein|nr:MULTISPECIES: hypothetical protein [Devosia]MCZ4346973.1 hypothetical protein [Devosia neptuniae]WDR00689.1 hypothetical protein PSC71_08065 [Devosia sp. J2-20]|tara:strand:+ start:34146 stop:34268 length:123 start_codon:yes stop_codon:yes gene_type:complete
MVITLPIILSVVVAMFGVFMAGLAYAAWSTRNIELTPQQH